VQLLLDRRFSSGDGRADAGGLGLARLRHPASPLHGTHVRLYHFGGTNLRGLRSLLAPLGIFIVFRRCGGRSAVRLGLTVGGGIGSAREQVCVCDCVCVIVCVCVCMCIPHIIHSWYLCVCVYSSYYTLIQCVCVCVCDCVCDCVCVCVFSSYYTSMVCVGAPPFGSGSQLAVVLAPLANRCVCVCGCECMCVCIPHIIHTCYFCVFSIPAWVNH